MNLATIALLVPLATLALPACADDALPGTADAQAATEPTAARAPGAIPPQGADAMARFLGGRRFTQVAGTDECTFGADGRLEARLQGVELRARWTATTDTLTLTQLERRAGETWIAAPDQRHTLGWLDGKLNVALDGQNFRDMQWSPGR